jgi:hypothetical protein
MLNDSLHFFVDEFDASDRRFQKSLDLSLDQQFEGDFRNKESWSWASRISNGGKDVHGSQAG